ncbi:TRAP transporter small permease [Methylomarinum vadi]|uniref:TRAP transporter small permease n=1 Tax=Methylomarinum vadi TaxID=438855 RepID=UPI0004DF3C0A|nr:TRAP transporter small permease [Methylomarinum vadi]
MNWSFLHYLHRFFLRTETFILVLLFLSLIILAVVQILLRNVFASGLIWAESYVRISVLWIAMIGAMIASRGDRHIAIDVAVKKLPKAIRAIAKRLTGLFSSVVCFIMAWYSLQLVIQEYQYGGYAFGVVPNWSCEAIIPFAFAIIALRYLIFGILPRPDRDS